MTPYGILLVDTSWENQTSVQIEKATHLRHSDTLVAGAKALIYVREPVDAVVAEAQITGSVIEAESESPDPAFNPAIPADLRQQREVARSGSEVAPQPHLSQPFEHTFLVPLNPIRLKGQVIPIPLTRLRLLLGSDFSVYDETWIPLSEAQYQQVAAEWDKPSPVQP